jgi:hypothetical protein
MLAAQAAGAQVHFFGLPLYGDGNRVNIGQPLALGMTLGVANIVAEAGCFAT